MSSRLYPERPILAASVAVFRDGRVLLAARTAPPYDQVFSLPGGLVEPGESLEQAALRELTEETGVTAGIVGFAGHVEIIERD
jgi:8-oxo-dGTP diphosphatase